MTTTFVTPVHPNPFLLPTTTDTPENIVDIATGSDDFNLLVRALDTAGLVDTVRGLDDVTVFAPTDAAFAALAADFGYDGDPADEDAVFDAIVAALTELGDGDPIPVLTNVLLYHVADDAKSANQIANTTRIDTLLDGAQITPDDATLGDLEPDLADPTIVISNIDASNGTIQAIDRVLLPVDVPGNTPQLPNIVDIAAGSDDFNLLVRALDTAGLVDTVRGLEDVTVFAPTDAAFAALAADFGYTGDPADEDAVFSAIVGALTELGDGDPIPVLTNVLLYHVSGGAKSAEDIDAEGTIATLLEGATFDAAGGVLADNEPDLADPSIAIADIAASNGTIQAIDRVLVPLDIEGNTTITDIVAASGGEFDENGDDFDLLLNAVVTADLAETLDDPNAELTVFAPTDDAFVATATALGFSGTSEAGAFAYIVDALTLLSGGGDPVPLLTDVLTYHVAGGLFDAEAVLGSESITTLLGADVGVDGMALVDLEPDLPNAPIIDTDIAASNGLVHVIGGVLIPADLLPSNGANAVEFIIGDDTDDTFSTGADDDLVSGKGGDDMFDGGAGNDLFVGGAGSDTAMVSGVSSHYALTLAASGVTVEDRAEDGSGIDTLVDVETLMFDDGFTFEADAGLSLEAISGATTLDLAQLVQIVELYVGYFNRAPDALGLYYWGTELADGMSIEAIAESFFTQDETALRLPVEDDHGGLVDVAYQNLFNRDADTPGREYWVGELSSGSVSRPEFMLALINGAKAETGSPADAQVVADKVDAGLAYAAVEGLGDVDDGLALLATYDAADPAGSLADIDALIDGYAADAAGSEGALTVALATVDDPFAIA